jgi:lysophospholipase L1-like esterase
VKKGFQRKNAAAIVLSSLLFTLTIVEITLRILGIPSSGAPLVEFAFGKQDLLDCYPTNPRGDFDIDLRNDVVRSQWEEDLGLSLETAAKVAPFAVSTHYNQLSFRGNEISAKRPGITRVVILGDSFTEGEGVQENFTFPSLLGQMLEAQQPRKWEVINAGQRGTDFPELYRTFVSLNSLEPDVVLYAMVLNDPEQTPEFKSRQKYLNDWILDKRSIQMQSRELFQSLRIAALIHNQIEARRVGEETTRWYLDMYGEPNRVGWEHTQSLIKDMARISEASRWKFGIVLWPLLVQLNRNYPFESIHKTIKTFAKETNIPFLDLLPVFKNQDPANLIVHQCDMHPNKNAHKQAANAILPFLFSLAKK